VSFRPRSAAGAASLALVSLLGLSACNSTPSHRRVVLDQIEALDLPADQESCMIDVVGTYDNGALDDIATAGENEDINWNLENALASGTPELQEFVERLRSCVTADGQSTETTAGGDTTEASDTTEPAATTESAGATEPAGTTGAVDTTEAAADTTEA
jgi:hypothetical protein